MKVLYIIHTTSMGGATISFLNMLSEMKKYGITPIIACPNKDKKHIAKLFLKKVDELNIKIVYANIVPLTFKGVPNIMHFRSFVSSIKWLISFPFKMKKGFKSIEKIIIAEHPDIVHSNVGVIHEGWQVCIKHNIPHVWHLREYQDLDFGYKIFPNRIKFEKMLSQSSVISITEDILRHFHQLGNPNAHVVYNGIFYKKEASYIEEKEPYFLVCSRISPEKGHSDVIKAFVDFCKKNKIYNLKIAGEYNEKNPFIIELKKIIQTSRLSNRIEFLGFQNDVKPLMQKAKAVIVASHNEGFGRMTAEACFCGCVVIGRNTSGTKEILDYTGGLQYDGSISELTRMMLKVADMDIQSYRSISINAMEKAKKLYSIESNGLKIYNIYKSILQFL